MLNERSEMVCLGEKYLKGIYVVVFLTSVLISAVSQILLKISADRQYESKTREYLNWRVIAAYIMFSVSSLLTVLAYRGVPLSMGPILETTGYLWVAVLGRLILKERVNARKVIGLAVIVFGVLLSGME